MLITHVRNFRQRSRRSANAQLPSGIAQDDNIHQQTIQVQLHRLLTVTEWARRLGRGLAAFQIRCSCVNTWNEQRQTIIRTPKTPIPSLFCFGVCILKMIISSLGLSRTLYQNKFPAILRLFVTFIAFIYLNIHSQYCSQRNFPCERFSDCR